jgi:hypothetical protein
MRMIPLKSWFYFLAYPKKETIANLASEASFSESVLYWAAFSAFFFALFSFQAFSSVSDFHAIFGFIDGNITPASWALFVSGLVTSACCYCAAYAFGGKRPPQTTFKIHAMACIPILALAALAVLLLAQPAILKAGYAAPFSRVMLYFPSSLNLFSSVLHAMSGMPTGPAQAAQLQLSLTICAFFACAAFVYTAIAFRAAFDLGWPKTLLAAFLGHLASFMFLSLLLPDAFQAALGW